MKLTHEEQRLIERQRQEAAKRLADAGAWVAELVKRKAKSEACRHEWHTHVRPGDRDDVTQCIYCYMALEHAQGVDEHLAKARETVAYLTDPEGYTRRERAERTRKAQAAREAEIEQLEARLSELKNAT